MNNINFETLYNVKSNENGYWFYTPDMLNEIKRINITDDLQFEIEADIIEWLNKNNKHDQVTIKILSENGDEMELHFYRKVVHIQYVKNAWDIYAIAVCDDWEKPIISNCLGRIGNNAHNDDDPSPFNEITSDCEATYELTLLKSLGKTDTNTYKMFKNKFDSMKEHACKEVERQYQINEFISTLSNSEKEQLKNRL